MDDQVQATGTPDTANPPTGNADTGSADTNWQERYSNLQPEYTRTTQRLSELEQSLGNEEFLLSRLQEMGYEFDDGDEDTPDEGYEPDFEDPYETLRSELDALKAERQQEREAREQAEAQAQEERYVAENLNSLEEELGHEFTDEERQVIGDFSLNVRDNKGKPQVKQAYELLAKGFAERYAERRQEAAKRKRVPKPGSGAAAQEQVNLDSKGAREDYFIQRLDEIDSGF